MAEKFSNLEKDMDIKIQGPSTDSNKVNPQSTSKHAVIKLSKVEDKKAKENQLVTNKVALTRLSENFSAENYNSQKSEKIHSKS